uniref:Uncharacterized protein n=1 Tax=Rhizophora mucronata TaxID=61149 RepID=A0A2P2QRD5_RHIMU
MIFCTLLLVPPPRPHVAALLRVLLISKPLFAFALPSRLISWALISMFQFP